MFLKFPPSLPRQNKRQKLEFCDNHMAPAAGALGSGVCDLIHLCIVIFMGTVFMANTQSLKNRQNILSLEHIPSEKLWEERH